MIPQRLTVCALVAAVLVAGCGGGGGEPSTLGSITQASTTRTSTAVKAARHAKAAKRRHSRTGKPHPKAASTKTAGTGRAEFIRGADKICGQAHRRLARLSSQLSSVVALVRKQKIKPAEYFQRAGTLTARSASVAAAAVTRIRALERPDDSRIGRYLDASAEQARLLADEAKAIGRGDGGAVHDLNERSVTVRNRSQALAKSVGFRVCGGGN